ncbi:hypothetical protein F183_A42250 [Bryobacterales bacterium F-183]|nr:hypothetical protein F183_A42250 [Bryobacterales bacterium F-183]
MKLPNGHLAIVDIRKLTEYCLNLQHPTGRHKARVFAAAGIGIEDAEILRAALLRAASEAEVNRVDTSEYGTHYVLDFELFRSARRIAVRSAWLVEAVGEPPRLLSCYIL